MRTMPRAFATRAPGTECPMDAAPAALLNTALASCLDIRAVWSIDHEVDDTSAPAEQLKLLVFADAATCARLHRSQPAGNAVAQLFVVIDGDAFEGAWGSTRSGSLARWAWRQTATGEAFYDEAQWDGDARRVVRVRRNALLLWRQEKETRTHERVYKD